MKPYLALGALVVIVILLTPFWLPFTDAGVRATLNANVQRLIVFLVNGAMVLVGLGLVWAAGHALEHVRRLFLVYPIDGLYPQRHPWLRALPADNQPLAQVAAAFVHGNVVRLPASPLRQLQPALDMPALTAPEPAPQLPGRSLIYEAQLAGTLALPIGIGANGPVLFPLRNLGNGVIGGLQGLGKSEQIAAMIAGLVRQDASGRSLQLAICDMKGGADFGRIPDDLQALRWPVARTPEAALALMAALLTEIDRRDRLFAVAGTPNIEAFNRASGQERLPYVIAFVDEIMFLTMPATDRSQGREAQLLAQAFISQAVRVSSIGRNAGVALVMATQRPSAEVIPTILRDLAGWRIAFRCANVHSSIAVLGQGGAEALPHLPGRCLVHRSETPVLVQSYMADLEGGRFDMCIARLPRGAVGELELAPAGQQLSENWDSRTTPTPTPTVDKLERGRKPSAEQAQRIRQLHAGGMPKTAICFQMWGYKDGIVFGHINAALEERP